MRMPEEAFRADLHLHTTASDGVLPPAEMVRALASQGFDIIAVTDHDTAEGVREAVAEGNKRDVQVVTGMELSTGTGEEVHLLGYGFDPESEAARALMRRELENRRTRMLRMVARLREAGVCVEAEEAGNGGAFMGRMNLTDALVRRGFASSPREAFDRYLLPGRPAYVPRARMPVGEGIATLRTLGAVVVLAHPGRLGMDRGTLTALLPEWMEAGLGGIEAYHSSHDQTERRYFDRLARRNGLLVTGGSDSHGRPGGMPPGGHLPGWPSMETDVRRLIEQIERNVNK